MTDVLQPGASIKMVTKKKKKVYAKQLMREKITRTNTERIQVTPSPDKDSLEKAERQDIQYPNDLWEHPLARNLAPLPMNNLQG